MYPDSLTVGVILCVHLYERLSMYSISKEKSLTSAEFVKKNYTNIYDNNRYPVIPLKKSYEAGFKLWSRHIDFVENQHSISCA